MKVIVTEKELSKRGNFVRSLLSEINNSISENQNKKTLQERFLHAIQNNQDIINLKIQRSEYT